MALTKPILYSVNSFDATKSFTFTFNSVGGDQVVSNTLVITNQVTGAIAYNATQSTLNYVHVVPANTLSNGVTYNAYVITQNSAGENSAESNTIQFKCYASATLTFTNIPDGNIVNNSEFSFEAIYRQSEGDSVANYIFNLYDAQGVQVATSGLQYLSSASSPPTVLSYTFQGLADNTSYSIECVVQSVGGATATTGRVQITVSYESPIVSGGITVVPNCQDGYMQGYIDWRQVPAGIDKLRVKRRRANEFNWVTLKEFDSRERTLEMVEKPQRAGITKFNAINNAGDAIVFTPGSTTRANLAKTSNAGDDWDVDRSIIFANDIPDQIIGDYVANNATPGYYSSASTSGKTAVYDALVAGVQLSVRSYGTDSYVPIIAAMSSNSAFGVACVNNSWTRHTHFPSIANPCLYQWSRPYSGGAYLLCHDYTTKEIYYITSSNLRNNVAGWQKANFLDGDGNTITSSIVSSDGGGVYTVDTSTRKVYFLTSDNTNVGSWQYLGTLPTEIGAVYGFSIVPNFVTGPGRINGYIVMGASACYALSGTMQIVSKSTAFTSSSLVATMPNIVTAVQSYRDNSGTRYAVYFVLDRAANRLFAIAYPELGGDLMWSAGVNVASAKDVTAFTSNLNTTAHVIVSDSNNHLYIKKSVVSGSTVTISDVGTTAQFYIPSPYYGYASNDTMLAINMSADVFSDGSQPIAFIGGSYGAVGTAYPDVIASHKSGSLRLTAVRDGYGPVTNMAGTDENNMVGYKDANGMVVRYEGNDTVMRDIYTYNKCATIGTKDANDITKVVSTTSSSNTITLRVSMVTAYDEVLVPSVRVSSLSYDGNVKSPTFLNYDATKITLSGDTSANNAGAYVIVATLKDKTNTRWAGGGTEDVVLTWTINRLSVSTPSITTRSYTYTGQAITPELTYDSDHVVASGDLSATDVGSYSITFTLKDPANYGWSSGYNSSSPRTIKWSINQVMVAIPTLASAAYVYSGDAYTPVINNLDESIMTVSGTTSATNVGNYTITCMLKDTTNYRWADYSTSAKNLPWSIVKLDVRVPVSTLEMTYTGSVITPDIQTDAQWVNSTGDTSATDIGTYTITSALKDSANTQWADGTITSKTTTWSIAFVQLDKGDLISMSLDGVNEKQYRVLAMNGNVAKVLGMDDISKSQKYNNTDKTGAFTNGTVGQLYAGSDLDTCLNTTWYNTLTTTAKDAIVPESRTQYMYQRQYSPTDLTTYQYEDSWSGTDYVGANLTDSILIGDRNIFALDLKDIFDYFGKNKITCNELMEMWTNQTAQVYQGWWLCSAYGSSRYNAWRVYGNTGSLAPLSAGLVDTVRPAFNIDLSKIPFTKVGGN